MPNTAYNTGGQFADFQDGTGVARSAQVDSSNSVITVPETGATFRTSAGAAAPGQTIKQFTSSGGVSINAGATAALYTVTAGKTFYLTDISVTTDSATPFLAQLKAAGTVIAEQFVSSTSSWQMSGMESQQVAGSAAAVTLVFPAVAGKNAAYFVSGFEQ